MTALEYLRMKGWNYGECESWLVHVMEQYKDHEIAGLMSALGKRGGKVKSEAKTAAVKKNASLGGIARANKYKQKRISEGAATPREPGAESVQSEKQNTADKSVASPELLPTQPHEHNHRCLQIGCGNKDQEQ